MDWTKHFRIRLGSGSITYIRILCSVIVRTDPFRIHSDNGRRPHHLYFHSLLWHRPNGTFHYFFVRWHILRFLLFHLLNGHLAEAKLDTTLCHFFCHSSNESWWNIEWFSSGFFRSVVGCGITYTSVFFSVIDWTDPFMICSVNGRRWHPLCICHLLCHWSNGFFQNSFEQWQATELVISLSTSLVWPNGSFHKSFSTWHVVTSITSPSSYQALMKRNISVFFRSVAGDGITYASLFCH